MYSSATSQDLESSLPERSTSPLGTYFIYPLLSVADSPCSILGATCMPHAFFIGSKMATMRRLNPSQYGEIDPEPTPTEVAPLATGGPMLHLPQPVYVGNLMSPTLPLARSSSTEQEKPSYVAPPPEPKPTLACINAHLTHAVWDITGSLLGFAVVINSAILILAAAVFYYGEASSSTPEGGITDLFDAYDLVKQYIGPGESLSLISKYPADNRP